MGSLIELREDFITGEYYVCEPGKECPNRSRQPVTEGEALEYIGLSIVVGIIALILLVNWIFG